MPADSRYFPVLAIPGGTANQVLTAVGDNTGFWADPTVGTGPVGPAGPTGPVGPAGAAGTPGPTGATGANAPAILYGNGAPAGGLGNIGDFYFDVTNRFLYTKIGVGAWLGVGFTGDPEYGVADQYGALLDGGCASVQIREGLGGLATATQTIYLSYFRAPKSFACTKAKFYANTAYSGGTPTRVQFAVYALNTGTGDLSQLDITANDTTIFSTTGAFTRSWSGGSVSLVQGAWYAVAALIVQTAGTLPNLLATPSTASGQAITPMASGPRLSGLVPASSALFSSLTAGSINGALTRPYAELLA